MGSPCSAVIINKLQSIDSIKWLQMYYQLNNLLQQHQLIAVNWNTKISIGVLYIISKKTLLFLIIKAYIYIHQLGGNRTYMLILIQLWNTVFN